VRAWALIKLCPLLLLVACMRNQPREKLYSPAVGPAQRPTGVVQFEAKPPPPPALTLALLQRGQSQFGVFCTPCHSQLGNGDGMIVQRGFPHPPNYVEPRLLAAPVEHFYDVITHGHGVMYSFADRVEPSDRWAIAAYIRALQLSQHSSVNDLTPDQRKQLP
jgi:mono/diheme cytochrome c family protein